MNSNNDKGSYSKGCFVIILAILGWVLVLQPFIETDRETDMLTNASWLSTMVISIVYWAAVYFIFLRNRNN